MGGQQNAPPMQSASPGESVGGPPIEQLKELAELKNQGILTEEEFQDQKAKLLGR